MIVTFSESYTSDLFVRIANNELVASLAGLHDALSGENPREVQRTSNVPHETEIARHLGCGEGLRMGGISSERSDCPSYPLHVPKLSCK